MWEEKAYLVTVANHSLTLPLPQETHSLSLSFHTLSFYILHAEDPLLTFSKNLDHDQLSLWLSRLMAVDYRHDIGKLKGIIISITSIHSHSFLRLHVDAKISGDVFLNLDKDSLERYGLSTEFQKPLMKIIEKVVCS